MYEIRIADEPDIATLAALRHDWSGGVGDAFGTEFAKWFKAEANRRIFWIAELDGQAVGMVNLVLFDRMPKPGSPGGGWGYLSNMFVTEAHRNSGVGAQLASALLDYAKELELDRVVLNPTERSRPFYQRLGFGEAGFLLANQLR